MVKGDIITVRNAGYYEVVVVDGDDIRFKRVMSTHRMIKKSRKSHKANIKFCKVVTKEEVLVVKDKITNNFDKLIKMVKE